MAEKEIGIRISSKFDAKGFQSAGNKLEGLGKGITSTGKLMLGLAAPVIAFGVKAVKSFQDSEVAQSRLTQGLKNLGKSALDYQSKLNDQASALQKVTRFSDEYVTMAQAQLTTFKLNGQQVEKLVPSLLDLSENTRKLGGSALDANQAANLLGKALDQGAVGPLKRFGVSVDENTAKLFETANKEERVAMLTDILGDNFGGFAEAAGKTSAGQLDILNNSLDDVNEQFGKLINDSLNPVIAKLGSELLPHLQKIADWAKENPEKVDMIAKGFVIIAGTGAGLIVVGKAVETIGTAVKGIGTALSLLTSPIGLATLAIAGVALGFRDAWLAGEEFKHKGEAAFDAIIKGGATAGKALDDLANDARKIRLSDFITFGLTSPISRYNDVILGAVGKTKEFQDKWGYDPMKSKFINGIEMSKKTIQGFIDLVDNAIGKVLELFGIKGNVNANLQVAPTPGATGGMGAGYKKKAGGGPVNLGSAYVVGEKGPEMFVPNQSGSIIPNGASMGSKSVVVYMNNYLTQRTDMTAAMRELGYRLSIA